MCQWQSTNIFSLFWEPHLSVLSGYSWLCFQISLVEGWENHWNGGDRTWVLGWLLYLIIALFPILLSWHFLFQIWYKDVVTIWSLLFPCIVIDTIKWNNLVCTSHSVYIGNMTKYICFLTFSWFLLINLFYSILFQLSFYTYILYKIYIQIHSLSLIPLSNPVNL